MKATCHREGLLSACQLVSAALPAREVKPILRNIKAVAEADKCTLIATDMELAIRREVRGLEVHEPGEAILPAAQLVAILREAQDEKLVIEVDANNGVIRGEHFEENMPSEDPANFPVMPAFDDAGYHEVSAGALRQMIRRTIFAVAAETGRYAYTGILWELDDQQARLVATDGKRLALATAPATAHGSSGNKGQTSVVPTKAMALLERNLESDSAMVRVALRPNEALFSTEANQATIYTRLVEGRFPNYRELFTKKSTIKIPLPVAPLYAAVRQAAIMADEESQKVAFQFAKKKLTLKAESSIKGRARVELPLEYDGKTVDINFNPKYLVEMLRVLDPESSIQVEMIDGNSPAFLRAGEDYTYVIMPLS
jgi:DNA polymerase-3 subunit beta